MMDIQHLQLCYEKRKERLLTVMDLCTNAYNVAMHTQKSLAYRPLT